MNWADAIQSVLTQGIDAAKSIKVAELQVNDPAFNSVGPNGRGGKAGQGVNTGVLGVSPVVLIGGVAVVLLLAFVALRK